KVLGPFSTLTAYGGASRTSEPGFLHRAERFSSRRRIRQRARKFSMRPDGPSVRARLRDGRTSECSSARYLIELAARGVHSPTSPLPTAGRLERRDQDGVLVFTAADAVTEPSSRAKSCPSARTSSRRSRPTASVVAV